jgi:hypothetical protein
MPEWPNMAGSECQNEPGTPFISLFAPPSSGEALLVAKT